MATLITERDRLTAEIQACTQRLLDLEPKTQAYRDTYIDRDAFLGELFALGPKDLWGDPD